MKSAGNRGVVHDRLQVLHVHVLLAAPLGTCHMTKAGTDQHQGRVAIGERPHHAGSAADLTVQPLDHVVCTDAGPMLSPILHELAEEKSGALKVGKVNVDEQMELAMRFQVSSIPMLVVFKDGKAVAKSVGYRPKSEIAAMVEGTR